MNSAEVARKEGVTRQAINQRLKKQPVKDALKEFIESDALKHVLIEVATQGLGATKPVGAALLLQQDGKILKAEQQGAIEVDDHNARHRFWHDLLTAAGILKASETNIRSDTNIVIVRATEKENREFYTDRLKDEIKT